MQKQSKEFNLIVTTFRYAEHDAYNELLELLRSLEDYNANISYTSISGLLLCYTNLNPFDVINSLHAIVREEPWRIRYILRCIPVEEVVNTCIEEISRACIRLADAKISMNESFRVTVEKRHSGIHTMDIVKAVAERIDRRVDLKNYDWNILVEVLGSKSGISVLKAKDVFSSVKVKRHLSIE